MRRQARPPHPDIGHHYARRHAGREYGAVADQIDAGNYSEVYEATGSFFRASVTAEEFRDSMGKAAGAAGRFRVPDPTSCDRTAVSGSPRCRRTDEWRVVGIYLIC